MICLVVLSFHCTPEHHRGGGVGGRVVGGWRANNIHLTNTFIIIITYTEGEEEEERSERPFSLTRRTYALAN